MKLVINQIMKIFPNWFDLVAITKYMDHGFWRLIAKKLSGESFLPSVDQLHIWNLRCLHTIIVRLDEIGVVSQLPTMREQRTIVRIHLGKEPTLDYVAPSGLTTINITNIQSIIIRIYSTQE